MLFFSLFFTFLWAQRNERECVRGCEVMRFVCRLFSFFFFLLGIVFVSQAARFVTIVKRDEGG